MKTLMPFSLPLFIVTPFLHMYFDVFAAFMQKVYADKSLGISESESFPVPVGAKKIDCELEDFETKSENKSSNENEFFD